MRIEMTQATQDENISSTYNMHASIILQTDALSAITIAIAKRKITIYVASYSFSFCYLFDWMPSLSFIPLVIR